MKDHPLGNLETRFDRLEQKLDQKFDNIDKKFDNIDKKFDNIDKKFDNVEQQNKALSIQIDEVTRNTKHIQDMMVQLIRTVAETNASLNEFKQNCEHQFKKIDERFDKTDAKIDGDSFKLEKHDKMIELLSTKYIENASEINDLKNKSA